MAKISIEFLGKTLKSPVFIGAGPNTQTVEHCVKALENGAGAVELSFHRGNSHAFNDFHRVDLYSVVPQKKDGFNGNYFGLISTGMKVREKESKDFIKFSSERIEKVKAAADENSMVVANIGSVGYMGDGVLTWGEMAAMVEDAGADAITLHLQTGNLMAGGIFSRDPEFLSRIVKDVRKNSSLPIIAKLPIEGCEPSMIADEAYNCGVDAVASTGRFIGLIPDIETGKATLGGHVGYGGSWVLPNTCAWAARMYRDVPERLLIPGGGINSWEDIVKTIMCGGKMVQACTWPMIKGYEVIGQALEQLENWLDEKGYKDISEIHASLAKEVLPSTSLWAREFKRDEAPMYGVRIDLDKCRKCRRCVPNCYFGAINEEDGNLSIDPAKCMGCGCCVGVCPFDAIIKD